MGTLVLALLFLGGVVLAQDGSNGTLAERQKAPTVLGGTGLFNTFSTRTLCKGEFNFALFWNNFDRDPGDLDINQVPFNFTIGLTNRWELWVNWVTWQQTTSRNPFLLSGYQFNAGRIEGDPFFLYGPPVGGQDQSAAFFPGGGSIFGGILPALGRFGTPIGLPTSVFSPGGPNGRQVRGLGPLIMTDLPSFYNDLPFFGEVDFVGFDALGRPVFGPRQSSNGSGDVYIGSKYSLIDPNDHWFSMALGGYLKIPISDSFKARSRGRTSGEFEYGPILIFGQESSGKRVRAYENIGYIHTNDVNRNDLKLLDLRDKLLLSGGVSFAVNEHIELLSEVVHTRFIGGGTPSILRNNPTDLNLGARFYLRDGTISFGGAYRYQLNNADDVTLPVFRAKITFVEPFFIINPFFETVPRTFEANDGHGFVGFVSVGSRKSCPPPPAPTCVLSASATTVNRGERMSITSKPSTPGYGEDKVTYEYRWEVKDAQGRPVTVSGSGAGVEVPTSQLACGVYSVTTTVTASVSPVDCPSDCVTTGQTTCTTTFEVIEPPCPTVTCDISASSASVQEGDRVTFRVSGAGDGLSYTWSATGGSLSSTSGSEVTLDTTGFGSGTITVSVAAATSRTRCDQACPGGSCSTSVTVTKIEAPSVINPVSPCGPIFFPFNGARINNEHKACLDEVALRLQQDPRSQVVIDGHRDSSERVGISLTRANNARDYMVNEKGIDAARITVRNFSDTCGHDSGDPNLNRRVEFWYLPDRATVEGIDSLKKCAAGASPRLITDEQPAQSDDKKRPTRRPRRRR
jgi:flagellar motor protein MotB